MKTTYTEEREITIDEAFQMLKANGPFDAIAWESGIYKRIKINLDGIRFYGKQFFTDGSKWYENCAIREEVDPRVTPDVIPELPEPWLAYIGKGNALPGVYCICCEGVDSWSGPENCVGNQCDIHYAVDVRTDLAKERYPEIVACYPEYQNQDNNRKGERLIDEVRDLARAVLDKGGREQLKRFLNKFDAKTVGHIRLEDLEFFMTDLKQYLEGGI